MPELPEVETVRRGLQPVMEGARIVTVTQLRPDLRFPFPADFVELLEEPLLNWVDAQTASDLISEGAIRVDTRLESEFRNSALPGAINIPLHQLRKQAGSMNRLQKFVLYCDTGQRSSAGAFLLGQLGFDAYVLKGGISHSTPTRV